MARDGKLILGLLVILVSASTADAHPPTGIVIDQKGVVYFTDLETIWKIGTNGILALSVGAWIITRRSRS